MLRFAIGWVGFTTLGLVACGSAPTTALFDGPSATSSANTSAETPARGGGGTGGRDGGAPDPSTAVSGSGPRSPVDSDGKAGEATDPAAGDGEAPSTADGGAGGAVGDGPGRAGSSSAADGCVPQVGSVSEPYVYGRPQDAGACSLSLASPLTGAWFRLDDTTSPAPQLFGVEAYSEGGQRACAVRSVQSRALDWGGGLGFSLSGSGNATCPFDATAYSGLTLSLRGRTFGTQGEGYLASRDTVRVNVVTTATSARYGTCDEASEKCNDHFGVWCVATEQWTRCEVPFDHLSQRGWGAVHAFDKAQVVQIQIVAVRDPDAFVATSWDIAATDVAFYP
jgi:hypothetical protein